MIFTKDYFLISNKPYFKTLKVSQDWKNYQKNFLFFLENFSLQLHWLWSNTRLVGIIIDIYYTETNLFTTKADKRSADAKLKLYNILRLRVETFSCDMWFRSKLVLQTKNKMISVKKF